MLARERRARSSAVAGGGPVATSSSPPPSEATRSACGRRARSPRRRRAPRSPVRRRARPATRRSRRARSMPSVAARSSTSSSFGSRAIPWASATSARSESASSPQRWRAHSPAPTCASALLGARVGPAPAVPIQQRQRDARAAPERRAAARALDQRDLRAQQARAAPVGQSPHVLPREHHAAAVGALHPRRHPQQRGLALRAPREHRHAFARVQIERDVRQHPHDVTSPARKAQRHPPQRQNRAPSPRRAPALVARTGLRTACARARARDTCARPAAT